jgi:hypothetical protein
MGVSGVLIGTLLTFENITVNSEPKKPGAVPTFIGRF